MIFAFVGVILLTALAVGAPALWLVRQQLQERAWSQVDQSSQAARALFLARQVEVEILARLTSQRPSLQDLLEEGEPFDLRLYLERLRDGTQAQVIILCEGDQVVGAAGTGRPDRFCSLPDRQGVRAVLGDFGLQAWLLAREELVVDESRKLDVLVGSLLDDGYAAQIHEQLGVDFILWMDGEPLASSLSRDELSEAPRTSPDPQNRLDFEISGVPYYSQQFMLEESGALVEVALDVAGIHATWNVFAAALLASILVVILAGSLLGIYLAGRISRPLKALAAAAGRFSAGDLEEPVPIDRHITEVGQLAEALARARQDLLSSLNRLQREKEWSDHLLESIVEGIITIDSQGHVTFFSHGAERITGLSSVDVIGRPAREVLSLPEMETTFREALPVAGAVQKLIVDLPSGRKATVSVTRARLAPTESGADEIALVFRDITQEEAIHRLLGQFLANIAHEFRTPLSALAASTELLTDQAPDLSLGELQELIGSVHLSVINLQTLIDNLLESASIEAGRFRVSPRPVELQVICQEAARTMIPLLEKYHQRLVLDLPQQPLFVMADPRRTIQVLVNLLSNASKYGPMDAEIRVEVGDLDLDGYVRLQVADRGEGIPAGQRQHIFDRFAYSTAADHARVGVGLGLSVVKAIVEALGGQVGVQERQGGGSVFWFTLPQAEDR